MDIWDYFPPDHYLSLVPWASLELESGGTLLSDQAMYIISGVAPEVLASLHAAHATLSAALRNAIADVVSGRASNPRYRTPQASPSSPTSRITTDPDR